MYKVRKINFGWYKRRHGILLENLPPSKQKLLLENHFMKWLESDAQTFEIIFKIEDMHEHEKNPNKILWNPFRETFTTIKEVEGKSFYDKWNDVAYEDFMDFVIDNNPKLKKNIDYKKYNFKYSKNPSSINSVIQKIKTLNLSTVL